MKNGELIPGAPTPEEAKFLRERVIHIMRSIAQRMEPDFRTTECLGAFVNLINDSMRFLQFDPRERAMVAMSIANFLTLPENEKQVFFIAERKAEEPVPKVTH